MLLQRGPGKRLDLRMSIAIAGNVRHARSGLAGLDLRTFLRTFLRTAAQEQGSVGARMPAEKASEFEAGIAGRAENRGLEFRCHQIFFKPPRSVRLPTPHAEAYLSIIMHKYASMIQRSRRIVKSKSKNRAHFEFRSGVRRGKPRLYETARTGNDAYGFSRRSLEVPPAAGT